jgi:hypothetical protein
MTRSVLVLGVAHELQGSKLQGYVDDPSYGLLLKSSMHGVDFVFEEASGLGPSKVEDLAISILGAGQYVDIDPSLSERSRVGATRLGRLVYRMRKYEQQYVDKGMEHYGQRYRDQQIQSLKKKAAKLGLQLLPALP